MELLERISDLRSRAEGQLAALDSQRKTENALVLPFFKALGYDPFDVREVEPEFDVGLEEQGMKTVDFALKKQGAPVMLVQCEAAETDLGGYDNRFLFQYFDRLATDIAVFTNGLRYRFYANLDAGIAVDGRPFLEFNLLDHGPDQVEELAPLTQPAFNTEEILSTAYNRVAGQQLRTYLVGQQQSPDDHLVRFMAAQLYEGEVSNDVIEQFRPVVQNVLGELFEDDPEDPAPTPSFSDKMEPADSPEPSSSEADVAEKRAAETASAGDNAELSTPDEASSTNDNGGAPESAELDGEDPFDKDLARRVIDDF